MAEVTIKAGDGVQLRVRVQRKSDDLWEDQRIDSFATESRAFEVGPGQRLVVEDNA